MMIDMRGQLGKVITTQGDVHYDLSTSKSEVGMEHCMGMMGSGSKNHPKRHPSELEFNKKRQVY